MAEKRTIELEVKESGFKSLKAQIKEANIELIKAQENFGDYSKEALKAAQNVAGLKDKIAEAGETAALFDPGKKFQVATGAITAAAGAVSAYQGAMGLLGVESEAVEEAMLRVQSAMALSQGLSSIADSRKDFERLAAMLGITRKARIVDAAATATQATVTTAATAATGKMTIAQRLLNLVMKANPIFLIIAGVAALTTAIILLNSETDNQAEKQKRLNKLNKEYREKIEKQIDLDTKKRIDKKGGLKDQEREIDLLKAKGATDKEVYEAEKKLIKTQLNDLAYASGYRGYLTKAEIQQKKDLNNSLKVLDAQYANDKADKESESAEKRKQNQEKNNAEYLRKQQEDNEKLKKAEQDLTNEIIKISQDWEDKQKEAREKRVEDAKTAEQDVYDNAIGYLEATLIADENNLQAKKDLLDVQRNLELQNAELTGGEVAAINAKYDKEIAEAEIANAKAVAEQKAAIQMQGLDVALQGVQLIKGVFEQQKGIQKAAVIAESAIGIAKMIIANKLANVAALATPQAIATSGAAAVPVIALNNISTGIGIAANIAATGKALKTLGGGTAPTAPPIGGGGGGGGGVSAPNFNIVGNSGINQLAELGGQPIQAYVVSGEVTSAQALDRNRIQNATF